jgi:hypothetical protein
MTPNHRPVAARLTVTAITLGLVAVLAGCSDSTAASPTRATRATGATRAATPTTALVTTTTLDVVPRYVSVGGHDVLMPTEEHHDAITAYSAFGQNVIITSTGFEPWKLYALSKTPIVFTNLTDVTQEVVFYHFPDVAHSGSIPPGGSYSFSYSAAMALVYGNHGGTDTGHLYIGGCPPSCS